MHPGVFVLIGVAIAAAVTGEKKEPEPMSTPTPKTPIIDKEKERLKRAVRRQTAKIRELEQSGKITTPDPAPDPTLIVHHTDPEPKPTE